MLEWLQKTHVTRPALDGRMTVRMTQPELEDVKRVSKALNMTMNDLVRTLLRQLVKEVNTCQEDT